MGSGLSQRLRLSTAHLEDIEARARRLGDLAEPRKDLPPEMLSLAGKLGVRLDTASAWVTFWQSGEMWLAPGGRPMAFAARQSACVVEPEFIWRATMGPARSISIADYLVDGVGGLEVRLFNVIPLARMVGGASMTHGEALRYLAELPLNPDAILLNRRLEWTVPGLRQLKVATGSEPVRAEITFELDDEGLITKASACSRGYAHKGRMIPHPWGGRFWDYAQVGGRLIPRHAEVAWDLDGHEFIYWRGRIEQWNFANGESAERSHAERSPA